MPQPARIPLLTHWTGEIGTVVEILRHGFLMPRHDRRVMNKLRPDLPIKHEPQAFGMVCLTDLPLAQADRHTRDYGPPGVVMSPGWAARNGARKVR